MAVELQHRRWTRRNPNRSFSAFYSDVIRDKIVAGNAHRILGDRQRFESRSSAIRDRLIYHRGRAHFLRLSSRLRGGSPHVVEFGCGSLRVGRHFIGALPPGAYTGLDVTDYFYRVGLDALPEGLEEDKRPSCMVISDEVLRRVRDTSPDLVFAVAVIKHVPPAELASVLVQLAGLIGANGQLVFVFEEASRTMRVDGKSWAYTRRTMVDKLERLLPGHVAEFEVLDSWSFWGRSIQRTELALVPRSLTTSGMAREAAAGLP